MILALLAGTKTQTRRIIKPQPEVSAQGNLAGEWLKRPLNGLLLPKPQDLELHDPFGQPGDRLWVRETCRAEELPDGTNGVRYLADNHFRPIDDTACAAWAWVKLYHYGKRRGATVPPIHAPRWTSRLLLEKTAGRVEQLQAISEADAIAEGIERVSIGGNVPCKKWKNYQGRAYCEGMNMNHAVESYRTLWLSLHGPGSWEINPWLWVEEFKPIRL
jgi:hypothetical protein